MTRFDSYQDNHNRQRVRCDLLREDGTVIGYAHCWSWKDNQEFIEMCRNTNISCKFSADTIYFDELDLEAFEE